MSDDEFLAYCAGMSGTPRCGFVPEHMARLHRLAGMNPEARVWDAQPHGVYDIDRDYVRKLVGYSQSRRQCN